MTDLANERTQEMTEDIADEFHEALRNEGFVAESIEKVVSKLAKEFVETKSFEEFGISADTMIYQQVRQDVIDNQ